MTSGVGGRWQADAMELTLAEALALRAAAQGLTAPLPGGPSGVVEHAVAQQGQDFRAVRSALAIRSGATEEKVLDAFAAGEVIRGWPMRGTLFATTRLHLASLLAHTGERMQRAAIRRRAELGLTDDVLARALAIAREALADNPLSRAQITALWLAAGLAVEGGRAYHLILHHAVDGVFHWGAMVGDQPALVLSGKLEQPLLGLDELVAGYLRGHGPATVDDIAWWLKLPKGQVRAALATIDHVEVTIDHPIATGPHVVLPETLDLRPEPLDPETTWHLPPFDEWFLGYGARELVSTPEIMREVVPGLNGVFKPLVVTGGQVVGTWSRER